MKIAKGRINKLDKAIKYSISFISSENLPLFSENTFNKTVSID